MSNHLFYFMGAIFSLIAWTVSAGIVPYPGDLEPVRPRFFGDSQ